MTVIAQRASVQLVHHTNYAWPQVCGWEENRGGGGGLWRGPGAGRGGGCGGGRGEESNLAERSKCASF